MTTEPRAALDRLIAAFEAHLLASSVRNGDDDPAVEVAYQRLADAFVVYDTSIYETYDEATPFVLYDDEEDAREDDADDDIDDLDEDDLVDDDDDDIDDDDLEDDDLEDDDLEDELEEVPAKR